ncbi:MAG: NUDIX domain-containing protein [Euzebya sp.]
MTVPRSTDDYQVTDAQVAYRSRFTTIRVDQVLMPDGHVGTREIAEHPSAVGAVVIDSDDTVVLLRHYRHALAAFFLELPAGKLDVDGEPAAQAMQRELAEEVELQADTLTELLTYTNSAGWTTERTTVYLATDLVPAPRPEDFDLQHEEADMDILRVPFDQAVAMVHDGQIVDSKTVIGLLMVADRRRSRH